MPSTATIGSVYKDSDGKHWSCEAFWVHPKHRDYHVGWSGQYAILQEYGNYNNTILLVQMEGFDAAYSLAWEAMKQCAFCGFMRMAPCTKRQTCASLRDYRLEPDDTNEPEAA